MEFIEKANAVELPGLDPDDLLETDPPNEAPVAPEGSAQANLEAKKSKSPDSAQAASQETVVIPKRRKSAPIPKDVLNGASTEPKPRLKNTVWIFGGLLILLILLLFHLKGGTDSAVVGAAPTVATNAPLISTSTVQPSNVTVPATTQPRAPQSTEVTERIEVTPFATVKKPQSVTASKRAPTQDAKPVPSASANAPSATSPRKTFWTPLDSAE